jgi:hypothetical protein
MRLQFDGSAPFAARLFGALEGGGSLDSRELEGQDAAGEKE